jgi:cobalamin biosynthetic protein CobC
VKSLHKLPDRTLEKDAKRAAASAFGASLANVLLTPGSSAAIAAIARLPELRSAAIVTPTYSEHARAFGEAGKVVRRFAEPDAEAREDALVLVNPNNPDGRTWSRASVLELAERRSRTGRWTIIDEAFADFFPEISVASAVGEAFNLIVLRSFGKSYGLAGLRLGAVAAPRAVLTHVEACLGPWPISTPALLAAGRAYGDEAWRKQAKPALSQRRDRLGMLLQKAGFEIEGDALLFVSGRISGAHQVWTRLCEAGVYVRRFKDDAERLRFGLPADEGAFDRLAAALKRN